MISESTTRQLLVRSGGRCALCYAELLTSEFTREAVYLGERAHIVGRSPSLRSPRGEHDLDIDLRDDLDNLLLACRSCHGEIDAPANLNVFTVEQLRKLKQQHESRIAEILSVPPGLETVLLRMHGTIGESNVVVDRWEAASAVLAQGRCARLPQSHDPTGIEIDLRRQVLPAIGHGDYYDRCRQAIDSAFSRRISPAVEDGSIRHLSVFALARWPLLVHLGALLGDKIGVDIYQRHRATESWAWPDDRVENRFSVEVAVEGAPNSDAVLVLSMSAAVHPHEVPETLKECRTYLLEPHGDGTPHSDVVDSPAALKSAETALRDAMADIEQHHKAAERLHVLGAAPLSVFVALGRVVNREIHPPLILHDRVNGQYLPVMEIH
ncbi:MAG: SAVED domain-containing protein [Acidimicrobiia bacterium]|nr:SAVED domain-containing protein [Acidimicrobiia bacterium]